jgi:hypothetical protein
MRKPIQAAVVPAGIVAAVAGAPGYRAQDSGSGGRLDERFNEMWAGGAGSSHWGC